MKNYVTKKTFSKQVKQIILFVYVFNIREDIIYLWYIFGECYEFEATIGDVRSAEDDDDARATAAVDDVSHIFFLKALKNYSTL